MPKTIDDIVIELLRKVQKKKDEIKSAKEKPQWKTNLSFGFDQSSSSGRFNIMTQGVDKIVEAFVFLDQKESGMKKAAEQLGLQINIEYLGYAISDWKDDLKTRANQLSIEQKQKEIDEIDKRVNKLISSEQRREMEVKALQAVLGD